MNQELRSKLWSAFEFYASGDFNEVANYEYQTPEAFVKSANDFVPRKMQKLFTQRIEQIIGRRLQ